MPNTSKRGFASMDQAKQREIASKGGRAAHAKGTAHEFTSDEARIAGRKGGETVSRDRAHMSAIGREGGHSRGRARAQQPGVGEIESGRGMDTERSNYVGQGNDRGTFGETDRGNIGSARNEQRNNEPQRNEQQRNEPQRNNESGISRDNDNNNSSSQGRGSL
jgi:general stress protein YciG